MSPFSGSVADTYILHAATTLYHTWKGSLLASPLLQINTRTLAATQIAYQYGTRFGRSIQPSILLKKISVQRSWQSQVQADSAANSPLAFPGHYTRMARGIRSELFRNSH